MKVEALDESAVLSAALAALSKARGDEMMAGIEFGAFASEDKSTGCWWRMAFGRAVGNAGAGNLNPDRERERRKVIDAWVQQYHHGSDH